MSGRELENTLKFRYYNFIKSREDNKTEDEVLVEMNVSIGHYQTSSVMH
ncbi:hypothetical protein GCM10008967_37620 [Bacillus carboniphilus]|uniref:Uncharacterized protein n=1 Tax=Bacillus carboniphilus TaxID=86663 RepID=A0ABP3GEN7_9BACI